MMPPAGSENWRRILLRGTNWVGDAVMTLPALDALHRALPDVVIDVLAKPWVTAVYEGQSGVGRVITYESKGEHHGLKGRFKLARELKAQGYDAAILFQNAFDAAFITWLARIPNRCGFTTDGRGFLLNHGVERKDRMRSCHETGYYIHMLAGLGLADPPDRKGVAPELVISRGDAAWADEWLSEHGLAGARLLGMAPGAAFGPAKRWPPENFANVANELADDFDALLLFGSPSEQEACAEVMAGVDKIKVCDLAGKTGLGQAMALLGQLGLLVCNDSGLMHVGASLKVPLVAIFGSTNAKATGPLGPHCRVAQRSLPCIPCKDQECGLGHYDCLNKLAPEEVIYLCRELMEIYQ